MATKTESKRPAINPTPLFAVVGVTDLAVERVRAAAAGASAVQSQVQSQFEARVSAVQADVEKLVNEFDPKAIRTQAQEVPNKAAARALEVASKAEATYEDLAKRGKQLVDRVRSQPQTQEFVNQAGNTISRGKAAVTVARKAADETATAILGTLNVVKREASTVVEETEGSAQTAAKRAQTSAKKTTTTARKSAAATKSAAKGAETSASKTTSSASNAAKAAAKKVGD